MVKEKRRTTELALGLIAVIVAGAAVAAGLLTASSGTRGSRTHASSTHRSGTHRPAAQPPTHPQTPGAGRTRPLGVPGKWKLVFDDEFAGRSLNRAVWNPHNGWTAQNGVTDLLKDVQVRNGDAILTLASKDLGAEIGTKSFGLRVGEFAQARIKFPGHGHTVYNWPAFWTSGPNWPAGGENDIAEGFGALTVNYHSPAVTHMSGQIPGVYTGGFHTYGIYRGRGYARVYWDGKVVGAYATADDGQPQTLLLTLGARNGVVTGSAGAMIVDYVRVWAPSRQPVASSPSG